MTAKIEKRHDALVALRKRDQAEALMRFDEVLYDSEKVAAAQESNRERIDALQTSLGRTITAPDTNTNAGRLARRIDAASLARSALKKQRHTEVVLASASEEMTLKLDAAKDDVAKSTKALKTLNDKNA